MSSLCIVTKKNGSVESSPDGQGLESDWYRAANVDIDGYDDDDLSFWDFLLFSMLKEHTIVHSILFILFFLWYMEVPAEQSRRQKAFKLLNSQELNSLIMYRTPLPSHVLYMYLLVCVLCSTLYSNNLSAPLNN